jgi:hypothetical protein
MMGRFFIMLNSMYSRMKRITAASIQAMIEG